jgi:DNA-directed RNA polymerase subunit RPC12/RpoP
MTRRKIRFLESTAWNDAGDETTVIEETDGEIYYYDGCKRWCYLEKSLEGKTFKFLGPKKAVRVAELLDAEFEYLDIDARTNCPDCGAELDFDDNERPVKCDCGARYILALKLARVTAKNDNPD